MPTLIKQRPEDGNFMPIFAHEAAIIAGQAATENYAWIQEQIGYMLKESGKSTDDYVPCADHR